MSRTLVGYERVTEEQLECVYCKEPATRKKKTYETEWVAGERQNRLMSTQNLCRRCAYTDSLLTNHVKENPVW